MQKKIFLTQQVLDQWSSAGKANIEGDILTIPSKDNSRFTLKAAVKFLAIESKNTDPNNWVGKVITSDHIKEKGVEVYMNSAIYKDEAYKVEEGFLGLLLEDDSKKGSPEKEILEPDSSLADNEKNDDQLLADFLLKNL
ncbi:MAG: hypothetical protein IME96_07290 [Proteobacteria bacterium]|nr:hypothetical protein [Pseudomonadota bacterium]